MNTATSGLILGALALAGTLFTLYQSRRGSRPDEFTAIATQLRSDLTDARGELGDARGELNRKSAQLGTAVAYIHTLHDFLRENGLDPPPVPETIRYPWEYR